MKLAIIKTAACTAVVGLAFAASQATGDADAATARIPSDAVVAATTRSPVAMAEARERACEDRLRPVQGQGLSCHVEDGIWKVRLRDGSTVLTHGPDPAEPHGSGSSGYVDPNATPRQPVCRSTAPYFRAILAVPFDRVGDKTPASFRSDIQKANGIFYRAAVESGSPNGADFFFLCDSAGQIRVDVVTLKTPASQATMSTIISELKGFQYDKTTEKYAVYYDAAIPGGAPGQGTIDTNSTDSGSNPNNSGQDYAIVYNSNFETLLHEMGHNLGAVQPGAPHATGLSQSNGWHCWEAWDVMCYNDGGNTDPGYIVKNCSDFDHFDCNHDDYFDAKIGVGQGVGAGSYLDTHWNIGECYVVWIVNRACSTTPGDTTPPTVTAPLERIDVPNTITSTTVPVKLTWSASDASGIGAYQLWVSTNGGSWVQDASITSQAQITYALVIGSTYKFAVRAKDGAGNWSGYAYGQSVTVGVTDEKSLSLPFGTWARYSWTSAFGGTAITSSVGGDSVQLPFTGRHVALVAPRFSTAGRAKVFCDGVDKGYVDLYASALSGMNMVVTCSFAQSASHTIRLVVEGTSNRPRFDVDAFAILS